MPLHTDAREPERLTDRTGMGTGGVAGVLERGRDLITSDRSHSAFSPRA